MPSSFIHFTIVAVSICIGLTCSGLSNHIQASEESASQGFANTRFMAESGLSPKADINSASWIAGHWRGEAWGGVTEEIWSQPLAGSMMASFRFIEQDEVKFYELITLTEVDNSLILKLKHFDADLTGWEEKDQTIDFRLVKVDEQRLYFEGYTFERVSKDEMNVYVVIGEDNERNETKFNFRRFSH